ncbi:MAG: MlaD family protein [Ignavibacteriales bacterium]|nr:MlaD family protein [Ignavibacteriales bacterium]
MLKQLEGARLGIFVFFGTVLFVISIFLLGSKEKLFTRSTELKAYFAQIEGLKSGAPVRLSGYDIGSVSSISFSNDSTGNVEVKMRIDNELKHFIHIDSEASIETEGLVGKKIVTITAGSTETSEVGDNGVIRSKNPVNISAIMEDTKSIMGNINNLTKDFSEIFTKINKGEGSVGKLVNDDQLYTSAVNATKSADKSLSVITKRLDEIADIVVSTSTSLKTIIGNIDSATVDVRNLIHKVKRGEGALGSLIVDNNVADSVKIIIKNLAKTSDDARIATSSLAENMEALKHNWLFKSYFEERGYWNQSEYEKAIDLQLTELKKQQAILDNKMKELKELESKINTKK